MRPYAPQNAFGWSFGALARAAGVGQIVLTFESGTNADLAQVDVQNRLARAAPRPRNVLIIGLTLIVAGVTHSDDAVEDIVEAEFTSFDGGEG